MSTQDERRSPSEHFEDKASMALKRLKGVDGVIALKHSAMSVKVGLMEDTSDARLLRAIPDLLEIATWAHYKMQESTNA